MIMMNGSAIRIGECSCGNEISEITFCERSDEAAQLAVPLESIFMYRSRNDCRVPA